MSKTFCLLALFSFISVIFCAADKTGSNTYGDEQVVPEGGGAQPLKNELEFSLTTIHQDTVSSATVEESGYARKKRDTGFFRFPRANEYGDEAVTPEVGGKSQSYGETETKEEDSAAAGQSAQETKEATHPVQSSGY